MKYAFLENGFESVGQIYSKSVCDRLINSIFSSRDFNDIFLSESEYKKQEKDVLGYNPVPGRNLIHMLDCEFIFRNEKFISRMKSVLGPFYRILDFKLVMGVPASNLPKWIDLFTNDFHHINLGQFVKPKYRDLTYFKGHDFHQDIIDFPEREPDFVTAYIYLDKVEKNTSPLYVVPDSHILGPTKYPHVIKIIKDQMLYSDGNSKEIRCDIKMLTGKGGILNFWHPFILHGTKPQKYDVPRISLRLLVTKNRTKDHGTELDRINKKIIGIKHLDNTRDDIDKNSTVVKTGNIINKY